MTGSESSRSCRVLVAGDITINWNIARLGREEEKGFVWDLRQEAEIYGEVGGARHLDALIRQIGRNVSRFGVNVSVTKQEQWRMPVGHDSSQHHHSYRVWRQFKREPDSAALAWRIDEFLGFHAGEPRAHRTQSSPLSDFDLVVISDTNLGFRGEPSRWPAGLDEDSRTAGPWILLKMGGPIERNSLWSALSERHADRLIVLITANELRAKRVLISRELSWERTATDLVRALLDNNSLDMLRRCAHLVVSLTTGGALIVSRVPAEENQQGQPDCRLVFDPDVIEESWVDRYQGGMTGYATCLAAAVAREVILHPDEPDLDVAVRSGVAAARHLHVIGYRRRGKDEGAGAKLEFPVKEIAAKLERTPSALSIACIPYPVDEQWSIVGSQEDDLLSLAEHVARNGEHALRDVPFGRFGSFVTVDRGEIEGFRSIRALVRDYDSTTSMQPLSIAVFGPPGSGKSYGIRAVVRASTLPGAAEELPYNLSQMTGREDLDEAFHQIRDARLRGRLPLVLWDEFDARGPDGLYGWLKYFLAPMQDGVFRGSHGDHPIGKAIFLFAGGTSDTLANFGWLDSEDKRDDFKLAKGPDFVSRLKGHVDIVGPDPRGHALDACFVLRRALMLRSMLLSSRPSLFEDGTPPLLNIDDGVLRAFLSVSSYRHGARSMELIIWMSSLHRKRAYEEFDLPAADQLEAHVDATEFLQLVQGATP